MLNYYQTLEVAPQASQIEIKQAYRRLVKRFHPDSQLETANHEKIISINAAYEILSDPQRRRTYDQQLSVGAAYSSFTRRQQRTAQAQNVYQRHRKTRREADRPLQWLKEVYQPIGRLIQRVLDPLDTQIDYLAADPFDQELMEAFGDYLKECRELLHQARFVLASQPNPPQWASVAAHLYYCLNQIGDGIDELEWFTLNYDEYYLHTGKELFRIAYSLYDEAQVTANV